MKIQSVLLKERVSKAVKGAGNNKLIPITELLGIRFKDGILTLETTDATNYLYVQMHVDADEEFYAVVDADLFAKLVAKTTSEFIELKVVSGSPILSFSGNGNYSIEMPLDEDGQIVKFPDPVADVATAKKLDDVPRSLIVRILSSVKPSLATTFENPCYTGYYCADKVLATDTFKIAGLDEHVFDAPVLLSPQTMDLLGLMSDDKIRASCVGNRFIFESSDVIVYSPEMEGKSDFAVDAITGLLSQEFEQSCELQKQEFLGVLDRLALFINPYDKNELRLTFANDGLYVASKAESGVERISYLKNDALSSDFVCSVDIEMLVQEVKAISSDVIQMQYGADNALKLIDGNLTIVLALLGE